MKKIKNSSNKKSCCLAEKSDFRVGGSPLKSRNLAPTSKSAQQPVVNSFAKQVYSALKKVPKGKITTYKDLANACGTNAYRAVGTALKNNPYAPKVPCHRVVASNGSIGGFMGSLTGPVIQKKINLLKKEGILIDKNKVFDFENKRFKF